jgi:probable phosphoglycerate mutase
MEQAATELVVEPRLNELAYGIFEGEPFLSYGAWLDHHGADKRPVGAAESQREGILRMLCGLQAVPGFPGDRVIVGHGLLLSVLKWGLSSSTDESLPLFLPEAPYVDPLILGDDELTDLVTTLVDRIGRPDTSTSAATFDGTCPLLEMKDSRYA